MLDLLENDIQKANILIVDDVLPNLIVLTEMIREAGYIARPVSSVKQAMQAIAVSEPQLILLDISMPDIDGFEWCGILKKNPQTRDIPIIFISALNSTEDKIRGFKLGAVDFISKPFEVEEVTLRINTHLKIHQMQQELEVYNKKLQKLVSEQVNKIVTEQKNLIYAMARISEAKDSIHTNHIENVARNSRLIALCLQLMEQYVEEVDNAFVETIELAAPLHDIGKIAIPDGIVKNSNNLSLEDNKILQSHAELGAKTLSEAYLHKEDNKFIKMAMDIVYYHHEKWDGTGYPKHLKGQEIPLSARIVSVVDAYDSEMEICSWETAEVELCHDRVMKYMNEEAGKSFDPELIKLLNKIQRQLRR
jgi:putative two-component system response regulator